MADLLTSARAKQAIAQSSFTSDENTAIASLVTAVSDAIRRWCQRDFDSQTYDELYNGTGHRRLLLRQFPILSINRVATAPTTVFRVTNTSSTNLRATVSISTASNLVLLRVSGVSTSTSSIALSGKTLSELASAVNAVGAGWSANAETTWAGWHAFDLRPQQGMLNAKDRQAELKLHVEELSDFTVAAEQGYLLAGDADHEAAFAVWNPGYQNYRVNYTAGFGTVPEPVQEAAAQWVAALFWQAKRDPGLQQEQVIGTVFRTPISRWPPDSVRQLLVVYRAHALLSLHGG